MRVRSAIAVLSVGGLAIACYLTIIHYTNTSPICTTGGCEKVQHSSYALLAGVPVALLGLVAYVAIIGTTVLRGVTAALVGAMLALVGVGFSGYLLWAQLARIHAICQWCLGNDVIIVVVAVLAVARLLTESDLPSNDRGRRA